jgi:choline-sulfatase
VRRTSATSAIGNTSDVADEGDDVVNSRVRLIARTISGAVRATIVAADYGCMSPSASNIVVIMSDQHRADLMGCAGAVGVRTPHLDRLAAEGIRFSRVNCQGPLCMPARASFMTERYVRDHGVYTNWAEVDSASPTYVKALRDAGYHTVMLGKAHLYRDEVHTARHVDDLAFRLEQLGFAEVEESGDKFSTSMPNRYTDSLRERGLFEVYRQHIVDRSYQGENETGAGATKRIPMWDTTPLALPVDAYIDQWQGGEAVRWIAEYQHDQPFLLFVGFPGPHDPWDAPAEAVARYHDVELALPHSTRRPDIEGTGTYGRLLRAFLGLSDTTTMTDDTILAVRRAYCADVSVIDDAVGRIVAALAAKELLDDTWLIYTSDHGEMGGDHGLLSKCVMYRQAVRVPLIIRPPSGLDGRVVDDIVEHLDVPATIRHIGGGVELPDSDGRSLLGHLNGDTPAKRELSISENWGFAMFETDRHKLVVDEDNRRACQLFDLLDDPTEDNNLLRDPACTPIADELMELLVEPFLATNPVRPHPSPFL